MKILITGAAGFLAQDIIKELISKGHEVIGIDNFSKYPKSECSSMIDIIDGDARDKDLLEYYLEGKDCFIPMAAMVGGIDYFHHNPFSIMSYNDELTQSALTTAIKKRISRVLLISSSMVFENTPQEEMTEEAIVKGMAPSSSYGFQKLNLEKYGEFAYRQYGLQCEVIRPFNAVGLGELQDLKSSWDQVRQGQPTHLHVIPELILKSLLKEDKLKIYGDGEQIRCFTSSKDIAIGVGKILDRQFDQMRYYHLSSSSPVTIKQLARLILKVTRPNENVQILSGPHYEWDVRKRIPQVEKTKEIIGFKTSIDLEQMIHEIHHHILSLGIGS